MYRDPFRLLPSHLLNSGAVSIVVLLLASFTFDPRSLVFTDGEYGSIFSMFVIILFVHQALKTLPPDVVNVR